MFRKRVRSPRALRVQKLVHYLTGFLLLLKGLSKLDHPAGEELVIVVALVGGIAVLIVTVFHDAVARRFLKSEAVIHCAEGLTAAVVGIAEFRHGTVALHLPWLLAAAALLVISIAEFLERPAMQHEPSA